MRVPRVEHGVLKWGEPLSKKAVVKKKMCFGLLVYQHIHRVTLNYLLAFCYPQACRMQA